ncbi:helix-turn-helix domain-containing protein [Mycolicibacterium senegalense]|uniref:HTH cro/C1-type domain-containing protein n=3 Tax=Mycolicibacterium senegalense TaxID=1796 RepID=A0ABR5G1Q3_9MYCO|nr:helix-turn-helix transcriptional regulator [Mycolicibacterium senegalense]KLO54118.1 hypothetical protein ABW05_24270 [Mycolicibacterium senegalense]
MTTDPASEFVPEWTDGDKLRKVRRHLGLSQEEFADRIQVKPSTYMAWESDRNRIKDLKTIARRIKVLTGTPLWWWFDTEPPTGSGPGPHGGGTPVDQPVGSVAAFPSPARIYQLPAA